MNLIDIENSRDQQLLKQYGITTEQYDRMLVVVEQANESYFRLTPNHEHFYKMLMSDETLLSSEPGFTQLSENEKEEWCKIKNTRSGDRGFVFRCIISILESVCPKILDELVRPQLASSQSDNATDHLDLSNEIDTLLLGCNIPACFEFLDRLIQYKTGISQALRRSYFTYIQIRILNLISEFLKAFENESGVMETALLNDKLLSAWSNMGEVIRRICQQASPGHHDPLSLNSINCLRSIYISLFNAATNRLTEKGSVPKPFLSCLPIIPDAIDFSNKKLEKENAWIRYQKHRFLFLPPPGGIRSALIKTVSTFTPSQRITWLGSLGKSEIRTLIQPLVAETAVFESLARQCKESPEDDEQSLFFKTRVWDALTYFYTECLAGSSTVSESLHELFDQPKGSRSGPSDSEGEADLSVIRNLSFLVVDDSERIRQMTIKVLREAGIERIAQAADGTEAWRILQKYAVDVVLCDWIMPNMAGIDLVKKMMRVERIAQKTTFLMLTTVNVKASIVEALSSGVRGYLIKPFTRHQLLEKVYFATQWQRKEQQSKARVATSAV